MTTQRQTGEDAGARGAHGAHDAHDKHAGHTTAMFRSRFWVTLALTVPVLVYAPMVQHWLGYTAPDFPGSELIAPVLGTVIFGYGGWPFLVGAVREIRDRQPGMMLLIGMAITVGYSASLAASLGAFAVDVWWELSLLIVIMLLGHWMEMRAIGQARGALAALAEMLPDEAERVADDGSVHTVAAADLAVGDLVLVRPGGRVPADGTIASGSADMDESMITGESNPVPRSAGERVVAATVATDSSIRVRVDAVGEDTALAGIQRMVGQAQQSRSRGQVLADRAAALLFYVAVAVAAITVTVWALLGYPEAAVVRSVTVLIIACPHALGLAIPLVTSISTAKSARNGILVKDRLALERMRSVDTVLFDKTGTLTEGQHVVTGVAAADGDETALLALAAAAESDSEHPLARAVVTAARERGAEVPPATGFRSMAGRGITAEVNGADVTVGGPALLRERQVTVPDTLSEPVRRWRDRGAAVLHVLRGDEVVGALALEDRVRPESRPAIDALHRLGVAVAMITGDARQVADAVAAELGIDEVFAEVLPENKDAAVARLQQQGRTVAMVGDGVNDAPALARADVGIAIGAGTDVAIESAGIVLASDDPRAVVAVRKLSASSYRKMLQNLWWAAGYNIVAIPLAAGVLAWAGIVLPLAVGAVLMSLSTIIVALNAQLLRRVDLRQPKLPT
ncbi:copper/silver-translocating P-type ATPase [Saccharomonospora marina XMU15]|uniref:Copper/silver-translocating P-type ATPase n=1 Tax=Saccharomonospora marina XMU15 TaxID=882083 RepID=H5X5P5_9PSEU|nr:heavy metal translocating P-type ATPase [Saccharomonospora marina]EHR51193.1 copper/silver-translocating P-type ATPase [Saccharomonospora marina XMU15]